MLRLLVLLVATTAHAEPQNFRLDYKSCAACHVAATGGGVLNGYGHSMGNAMLSTIRTTRPATPEWFNYDVNYRKANVNVHQGDFKLHEKIPMQFDGEVAVQPLPGVTLDASYGVYGLEEKQEYRRNYVQLAWGDALRARVGHFTPSMGINVADHIQWSRERLSLGQGNEQYGAEVIALTSYGEVQVSRMLGDELALRADDDGYKAREEQGATYARASAYVWDRAQVGFSGRWHKSALSAWGAHAMYAPWEWLYFMGEADVVDAKTREVVTASKLGFEAYRGVLPSLTYETDAKRYKIGAELQLMPCYGLDITGRAARTYEKHAEPIDELVAVLHIYL